jgi:hypothetical protein
MPHYKHTQIGYVTGGVGAAATVFVYYASRAESDGLMGWGGWASVGGFALLTVLFSSLTVIVDEDELRFYFGPGFWTRRIPLSDIRRVEAVRTRALHGWGIRYTFHGWLYNVSGLRAVELEVDGEGTIRVGTDEPEKLQAALERARRA